MDKISVVEQIINYANEQLSAIGLKEYEIKIFKRKHLSSLLSLKTDILMKIVCDEFDVSHEQIVGKKRDADIIDARFMFCYLATEIVNMTRVAVGRIINRHHTTIINAIRTCQHRCEHETAMRNHLYYIKKRYYEYYENCTEA